MWSTLTFSPFVQVICKCDAVCSLLYISEFQRAIRREELTICNEIKLKLEWDEIRSMKLDLKLKLDRVENFPAIQLQHLRQWRGDHKENNNEDNDNKDNDLGNKTYTT